MNLKQMIMKTYLKIAAKVGTILAIALGVAFFAALLWGGYYFLITAWYLFFTTK